MKPRPASWTCEYVADRRKHRHRCRCCNRIVQPGERVMQARVADRGGRVLTIHETCAPRAYTPSGRWTWGDALTRWGRRYQIALGYKLDPHPTDAMAFAEPVDS